MRNNQGHWVAFNRENKPLDENDAFKPFTSCDFIYTNYGKLSDKLLTLQADGPISIHMCKDNVITMVFLYDDAPNPSNHSKLWDNYFEKLLI